MPKRIHLLLVIGLLFYVVSPAAAQTVSGPVYIVQSGDTLSDIAARFNVSMGELMNANGLQETMAWLLAGSMAMSAAGSFRRERDTGVLELLLVSPLGENQIISGRLGGLWSQFLPAAGLLLAVWAYCSSFLPNGVNTGVGLFFVAAFLTVPVFGLYFSLSCRNFITAFLATLTVALLVPLVLPQALRALWLTLFRPNEVFSWEPRPSLGAAIFQVILAIVCWDRLFLRLKERAFPLERTMA